ncbi:hypothetical protein VNO78_38123 [Psophocarpus tetragonolobus]|uniref:Uncharacterized protein n=1 Tax=Psophocarpus tetragonolobus TaxID=3891 RepID=A0AAN9N638_PSOTE
MPLALWGVVGLLVLILANGMAWLGLVPVLPTFSRVRFRRGSLRNGYHIQGRQQARKLPNPDTGSWTLGWVDRSASGVHRLARPFCRRCAPGLNWPGRASGAVTLKKLECSKQAYALDTLAWDNTTGF